MGIQYLLVVHLGMLAAGEPDTLDLAKTPICISSEADNQTETLVNDFRIAVGSKLKFRPTDKNPVCCLWFEVTNWKPNPGSDGYIIVIQEGGGIVMASSHDQVKEAISRIKQEGKATSTGFHLPIGLMTNYKFIPNTRAVKTDAPR